MLTAMIFAKDHDALVAFYRDGFELDVEANVFRVGPAGVADPRSRLPLHRLDLTGCTVGRR